MPPEILMLLCLKQAQEHFIDRVCSQAKTATTSLRGSKKDAPVFLHDHQDKLTRIAEFFYLMRASAPLTAERVEAVAREHNARLHQKIASIEDPWMNAKLRKGLFSPSAVRMLAMNNAAEGTGINLSQSDLARFFCETMSDELTRNLVTVLVDSSHPDFGPSLVQCQAHMLPRHSGRLLSGLLGTPLGCRASRCGWPSQFGLERTARCAFGRSGFLHRRPSAGARGNGAARPSLAQLQRDGGILDRLPSGSSRSKPRCRRSHRNVSPGWPGF